MSARTRTLFVCLSAAALGGAGCLNDLDDSSGPAAGPPYDPEIPDEWAAAVTNPYFPLEPGTVLEYRADTDEGVERTVVEVLRQAEDVEDVSATVVRDRVFLDGELREDTLDWYAQDSDGNVWYLGEETKEYLEDGTVSTEGSWRWGADGALPGIIMWADPAPHLRQAYRQEYYAGVAEDWGKVLATGVPVEVPYGDQENCVETLDWSALDAGTKEHKFYAPGIGLVLEIPKDADERLELISVRR